MAILSVIVVLVSLLPTGSLPAAVVSKGELTIVASKFGQDIPIPAFEVAQGKDILKLIYDPLVGSAPDGELSPDYGVAYRWEKSSDARTWTFYLRKGIKFHDGVELTAKDVKFTIEMLIKPDAKVKTEEMIRDIVKSIDVKDPYTLVVNLKQGSLFLAGMLSDVSSVDGLIIPKDYYERVGEDKFMERPIGSGPYKFNSKMIGSFTKLEATEKHWRDGVPRYKYVTFRIIPEEMTRIAMLKTGEANISEISRAQLKEVMQGGLNVVRKKDDSCVSIGCAMQWVPGPMSDARFRKALALSIDKEAIIKNIFAGEARQVSAFPGVGLLKVGGDPALKPYPYAPEEARRLLKEGGYEGHEFTVMSYPRGSCPEYQVMIEAIAGYWQKIGLKPKIFMTEYAAFRERRQADKIPNTIMGGENSVAPTVTSVLRQLSGQFHSAAKGSYCKTPEFDKMLDRAGASMDLAEVKKFIGDMHHYIYNNYIRIPICQIDAVVATTKDIPKWDLGDRGFEKNLNGLIRQ